MTHPLVYEINARCWLRELSMQQGTAVSLGAVPETEVAAWRDQGFTHVWLMGIWPTGPKSRGQILESAGLRQELDSALGAWHPDDVSGSPFAVAGYEVPRKLGGESGLRKFREQLRRQGLGLILDFVPNHVGLDHPWLTEHPEYFVQTPQAAPGTFPLDTPQGRLWIAHGKDPNFPPWTDTAQLDYRRVDTQRAVAEAFAAVTRRCDGVRCDMAMLQLRDVFQAQWQGFPAPEIQPEGEFWANLIRHSRREHPGLLLLAEVYWDLEARLQSLGFDYTYDKRLYDYLVCRNRGEVRRHLGGVGVDFLKASAHFLENHDEPRVATLLGLEEHQAAALLTLGLPGLRLLHEGQLEGWRTRLPVHVCRRLQEPCDQEIAAFYELLLPTLCRTAVGHGEARLLQTRQAWPENPTDQDIVVVQWRGEAEGFDLVVANLAPHRSQAYVTVEVPGLNQRNWRMKDLLGTEDYQRYGDDLQNQGLYLDVAGHAGQLFHFSPLT